MNKSYLFHACSTSVLLFIGCFVSAQPYFDVANVHYINSPAKRLISTEDNPSAIQYLSAQIGVPVKLGDDILILNPFYETYQLNLNKAPGSEINLYSIGFPVVMIKQWKNKKWKTGFVFIPRVNSDFKNLGTNDYQYGGVVLAIYEKRETLKYKFGIYYNSEFFGPFFIPLLGIDWNINERTNLFGVLPSNLALEYKINSALYGGVNFKSITNSYRFNDHPYLKIVDNYLKLYLDYYPLKNFALSLEAGHSVLRKYTIGNIDGYPFQDNFGDGWLLKVGLAYRVRLSEKK